MKTMFIGSETVADKTVTFLFKKPANFSYIAGQFIELYLPHKNHDERGAKRWFTLSSSPTEETLAITTKLADKPSTFKQTLFLLKPGIDVEISQPMGDFVLPINKSRPLIFVAAGIGATPFRSMCVSLGSTHDRNITMYYGAKNPKLFAFKELFAETTKLETTTERLDLFNIKQKAESVDNPLVYLSGPEELVESLQHELAKSFSQSQLLVDYFHNYN